MNDCFITISVLSTILTIDVWEQMKNFVQKRSKGNFMKTNTVKKIIYDYLKEKIFQEFPENFELMEDSRDEIFWGRLKDQSPDKIYITLIDKKIAKINKRFEEYKSDGKYYRKRSKQLLVTFGVYALSTEDFFTIADVLTVEIIEFIERLFTESRETFNKFAEQGIVINELEVSDIRDFSKLSGQTQEFRKEFDLPFEYEDIEEFTPETGKELEIHIDNF